MLSDERREALLIEVHRTEHQPMLHDELFESYWTWVERREDPGWRLDSAEPS